MDSSNSFDELFHLQMQGASQQIRGTKSCYIGYIVQYDPDQNTVTVSNELAGSIPSAEEQTNVEGSPTGIPLISHPIPLATAYAGIANGINPINPNIIPGIVLAPIGGASSVKPTAGEQVLVLNINNEIGYSSCAYMLFNDIAVSPGKSVPISNVPIKPGEWLGVNPSGSYFHVKVDGTTNIGTIKPPSLLAGGNFNLKVAGVTTLDLTGSFNLESDAQINLTAGTQVNVAAGAQMTLASQTNVAISGIGTISETATNINRIASNKITDQAVDVEIISSRDTGLSAGRNMVLAAVNNLNLAANNNLQFIAGQDLIAQAIRDVQIQSLTHWITLSAFTDIFLNATNGSITATAQNEILLRSLSGSVGLVAGDNATTANLQNIAISAPRGNILFQTANGQPMTFNAGGSVINNVTNNYTVTTTGGGPTGVNSNVVSRSQGNNVINSGGIIQIPSEGSREILIAGWGDVNIKAGQGNEPDVGILRLGCPNDITIDAGFGANEKGVSINATGSFTAFGSKGYQIGTLGFGGITQDLATTTGTLQLKSNVDSGSTGDIELNAGRDVNSIAARDIDLAAARDIDLTAARDIHLISSTDNIQIQAAVNIIASALTSINMLSPLTAIGDSSGHTALSVLTTAFLTAFNGHVHSGVTAGGANSGPPTSTVSAGYPISTNALKAN